MMESQQSQVRLRIHAHIFIKYACELLLAQTSGRSQVSWRIFILAMRGTNGTAISGHYIIKDAAKSFDIDIAFGIRSQSFQEEFVEKRNSFLRILCLLNLLAQHRKLLVVHGFGRIVGA